MTKKIWFVLASCLGAVAGCPAPASLEVYFNDTGEIVVPSGEVVSVSVSTRGGLEPIEYFWEWSGPEAWGYGNGNIFRVSPPRDYIGPIKYMIKVVAVDCLGHSDVAEKLVTIGAPPLGPPSVVVVPCTNCPGTCGGDCGAGKHCENGACVPDGPPPCGGSGCPAGHHCQNSTCVPDVPAPTVDLKVCGSDGPIEVPEGRQLQITWDSTNATRAFVESEPETSKFRGERDVTTRRHGDDVHVPELATLPAGTTWILKIVVAGQDGASPSTASDSVVVKVGSQQSDRLCITSVVFSPPGPFNVRDWVTVTVNTTGRGTIHYIFATSSTVNGVEAEADGSTILPAYQWPKVTGENANSYFWPDDRDFEPDIVIKPTEVN